VGETVAAAGRPLEALPALAVAEHLAAHALQDAGAAAKAKMAQVGNQTHPLEPNTLSK